MLKVLFGRAGYFQIQAFLTGRETLPLPSMIDRHGWLLPRASPRASPKNLKCSFFKSQDVTYGSPVLLLHLTQRPLIYLSFGCCLETSSWFLTWAPLELSTSCLALSAGIAHTTHTNLPQTQSGFRHWAGPGEVAAIHAL